MDMRSIAPAPLAFSSLADQRNVYLQRLERLQRLRLEHERDLNHRGIRLLDRSLFATYCVCRDLGAKGEALAILANLPPNEAA